MMEKGRQPGKSGVWQPLCIQCETGFACAISCSNGNYFLHQTGASAALQNVANVASKKRHLYGLARQSNALHIYAFNCHWLAH